MERTGAVSAVDRAFGGAIERTIVRHHRQRLRRVGWSRAFDAPAGGWAAGVPPPRSGNSLEILIDGSQALPRMVEVLEGARSHVHLAGWHFSPEFALRRGEKPVVLRNFLAELAERVEVRLLAWAGAPLPLFRPSRRDVRNMQAALANGTRVHCALDARERLLHCHHEKLAIVDDEFAFVGGIDLTSLAGDRFDGNGHHARASVGWHDAAALVRGPAVADVRDHFAMRWREVTGESIASSPTSDAEAGNHELQIVRTVPERIYGSCPRGDFRILESYVRALKSAQELVYIESQFLWSPEVSRILADKLRRPPTDRFRVLVVLPARPNNGQEDTRGTLAELAEADDGSNRLLACTLYARAPVGSVADPIYVHAKIAIVDDRWLTIGPANLNEHSLFNDTEMNLVTHDPVVARETRLRLWAEHLERPLDDVAADPADVIDTMWRPTAAEQLERRRHDAPLEHRLVRLPHVSARSRRLRGPLDSLLVDS